MNMLRLAFVIMVIGLMGSLSQGVDVGVFDVYGGATLGFSVSDTNKIVSSGGSPVFLLANRSNIIFYGYATIAITASNVVPDTGWALMYALTNSIVASNSATNIDDLISATSITYQTSTTNYALPFYSVGSRWKPGLQINDISFWRDGIRILYQSDLPVGETQNRFYLMLGRQTMILYYGSTPSPYISRMLYGL